MNLVEVQALGISFGDKKALKGSTFSLNKGECLGVVGESGSGKSLTALAILGLLPNSARINKESSLFFDGQQINKAYINELRGKKVGIIFQEPMTSLNPVIKCGNQVVEVLEKHLGLFYNEAKEKTLTLFKQVLLRDAEQCFNKYPHQLSGGQKQRVMIAMAIACGPDLLIADEPTTALDVTVQKEIVELLHDLRVKKQMSLLFISHDLSLVAQIADKVLVMRKGEIVEEGDTKQVFTAPEHPYTKALIACRPPLDKRYKQLPTINDFIGIKNQYKKELELLSEEERKRIHEKLYTKQPILKVENLYVTYPTSKNWWGKVVKENRVVNDVSFDLYEGETLGIVGESGCGKTTIGRTIVKLKEKKGGHITYKGEEIFEFNKAATKAYRKEVQIIFQDPYASLNPRMRIGEAIMEPMLVHGIGKSFEDRKKKTFEIMNKVGLNEEQFNRYPHEFSGGQRQRISIARTLALDPSVIICDESVSALDVSIQAQVLNLLNKLKREHQLTFIFISHDLSVVKHFCDRMLVLNKSGQIEEQGESDQLYKSASSEYTKNLIRAIPKGQF